MATLLHFNEYKECIGIKTMAKAAMAVTRTQDIHGTVKSHEKTGLSGEEIKTGKENINESRNVWAEQHSTWQMVFLKLLIDEYKISMELQTL